MKKWCCDAFQRLMNRAGEKGVAIIACRDGDHRSFYLQARPFEKDVVELYNSTDPMVSTVKWPELLDKNGKPVPWVSALHLPLTFCPRCGADLRTAISARQSEFDRLAEEMRSLWVA